MPFKATSDHQLLDLLITAMGYIPYQREIIERPGDGVVPYRFTLMVLFNAQRIQNAAKVDPSICRAGQEDQERKATTLRQ